MSRKHKDDYNKAILLIASFIFSRHGENRESDACLCVCVCVPLLMRGSVCECARARECKTRW